MRTVKFDLTETVMESTSWDFRVNERSLGEHLSNMMKQGKFVGSITITIKETAEYIEPEVSTDDENSN